MARKFPGATEVSCACVRTPGRLGCECTITVTDAVGKRHSIPLGGHFASLKEAFTAGAAWSLENAGIELAPTTARA